MLQIPSRCGLLNVSIGPESVERWLDLNLRQTTRYRAEERGYYTLVCRARKALCQTAESRVEMTVTLTEV